MQFSVEEMVCIEQNLSLQDYSANTDSILIDYCAGDLNRVPTITTEASVSGTSGVANITLFQANEMWHGFLCSRNTSVIHHLTFGASLDNTPMAESYGNIDSELDGPESMKIVFDNNNYYGFLVNSNSSELIRLDFGDNLGTVPSAVNLGNLGFLSGPRGIDMINVNNNWVAVVTNFDNELTIIQFSSIEDLNPSAQQSAQLPNETGGITSVSLTSECDTYYGLVTGWDTDRKYRVNFGTDFSSFQFVEDITDTIPAISRAGRVQIENEGGRKIAFITTLDQELIRLDFGSSILNTPNYQLLATLTNYPTLYSLDIVQDSSIWRGFYASFLLGRIGKMTFPNLCGFNAVLGDQSSNVFSAVSSGDFVISVTGYDESGLKDQKSDTITILSSTAPDISFTTDNACIESSGNFTPNLTGLPTYSWDFNNDQMEDSDNESPEVKFDTLGGTGEYIVRLDVNDGTCDNFVRDTIKIYPEPPDPTFTLDASVFCQDVDIGLSNTTDETGYDDVLSYSWTITDLGVLNQDEPSVSFANTGAKNISVSSSLPGCTSNPTQQDISVQGAPAASFAVESNCLGEPTTFDNGSASGLDYAWTFGDGFESTLENPSHEYGTAGDYTTTLVVTDDIGCATTVQETLQIFPNPEPGFQYGLICEDDSVVFQDTSTVENGDVEAWEWYVNDVLVSNQKDPKLSFSSSGDFVVRQVVSGTGECAVTNERTVNILEAPVPSFDIVSACVGESFTLLNTSAEGSYLSREFSFGDQVFEEDTVLLEISSPGTYEVMLTLGNKNLCSTTLTKSFTVTAPPEFNIQSQNICANESTILEDLSTSNDQIISRTWSVNGEEIGNGTQVNYLFGNAGSYDLSLELITENGCEYSYGQSITILDPPTAEIQASSDYAILGNSIQFSSLSSSDSIYWYLMGDSLRSDSTFSRLFNEEGTFNFSQVVIAEDGCLDTASLDILVATPDVDLRLMSFEIIDDGSGFGQVIAAVFNESNLPIEDIEFTLTLDNALPLKERFTNRIGIGQSGIFNLNTSIPLSQNFVSTVCLQVTSPISEVDATPYNNENCLTQEKKAVIEPPFPNPASGELTINIVLPEEENVSFRMLDMTGKQKLNKSYPEKFSGLATFILELQEIPPGLYFLEITTGDRVNVSRIAVK